MSIDYEYIYHWPPFAYFLLLNWKRVVWFLGKGWAILGFDVVFFLFFILSLTSSLSSSSSTNSSTTTGFTNFCSWYRVVNNYYKYRAGISLRSMSTTSKLIYFFPTSLFLFTKFNFFAAFAYYFCSINCVSLSILCYINSRIFYLSAFSMDPFCEVNLWNNYSGRCLGSSLTEKLWFRLIKWKTKNEGSYLVITKFWRVTTSYPMKTVTG